jgi:hypothetical protein
MRSWISAGVTSIVWVGSANRRMDVETWRVSANALASDSCLSLMVVPTRPIGTRRTSNRPNDVVVYVKGERTRMSSFGSSRSSLGP